MSTLHLPPKQAAAWGGLRAGAPWHEARYAAGGTDSGIGIGLVVVDAASRWGMRSIVAGNPSRGAANVLFAATH
jgi:hypothetical protein